MTATETKCEYRVRGIQIFVVVTEKVQTVIVRTYMGYYDSSIGRFISEDPARANGGNWYAYCMNNPVNFKDPKGLWMEGDENLTQGAQTYTTYYGNRWSDANARREACLAAGDVAGAAAAQADMDNWHALADDIRSLDGQGLVTGNTLAVPVYNQMNTPPMDNTSELCWATSTAMVASFILGDTTDRTLAIATAITGATTVAGYNLPQPWVSTDNAALGLGITVAQTQTLGNLTMADIQATIDGGNPFGVLYRDANSGHWIVGVGYASAPGHDPLVVSNDPWGGVQNIQTYNDFQTLPDGRIWTWTAR